LSFINLIRVAYLVRRPCCDFTDMLRRLINCRIIIKTILIRLPHSVIYIVYNYICYLLCVILTILPVNLSVDLLGRKGC